ncbi:MAG: tetratricopeptide repeat protein [Treponema sp.]|jgi:tetratricopeptide (TPR) repeat protein|nr:tetratricopeptide repeat protein [Treponema sp.]
METSSALNNIGIALTQAGKPFEAIAIFDKAITLDRDNSALFLNKGLAEQKTGNYEAAISCFEKALELYSGFSDAWAALGLIYYETGRLEIAEYCYMHALKEERKSETLNNIGVLCFNRERYEDARCYFEEALSPFFYDALYNLRDTCEELNDFQAASEMGRLIKSLDAG